MKKWKKALSAIAVATVICIGVGVSAGCGDNNSNNGNDHSQHNSWSEWQEDATQGDHYRECLVEGCDKVERGEHSFDNEQDTTCNDCGYVRTVTPSDDMGSKDNPYTLAEGSIEIDVPAGGSVYYSAYTFGIAYRYTFISDSQNVSLSVYNSINPAAAVDYNSDADGFYCEVESETMSFYYFVFSSKDGSAAKYSVNVSANEAVEDGGEEGSASNPIIITDLGKIEKSDVSGEVFYRYTVTADDAKLYLAAGENTMIVASYGYAQLWSTDADDAEKLLAGLEIEAGTVITITVLYHDENFETFSGDVSFTISNAPIGGGEVENPADAKAWEVTVAEGVASISGGNGLSVVYYSAKSGDNGGNDNISKNSGDFKMNDKDSTITITLSGLKAGQIISIKAYGFSGSNIDDEKTQYNAVDLTVSSATNAQAAAGNPADNKVGLDDCSADENVAREMGTFVYEVSADGDVVLVLQRSLGKTTRVTRFDIEVK